MSSNEPKESSQPSLKRPKHNALPEAKHSLPRILSSITHERDEVKAELQRQSNQTAADVDGWIAQARRLQADIERSKQTAREIVREAEAASRLEEAVHDASNKVELLRKELDYNDTLATTIDTIQVVVGQLDAAQDAIAEEELVQGLERLEIAGRTLSQLDQFQNARFLSLLHKRKSQMKEVLSSKAQNCWSRIVQVRPQERQISILNHDGIFERGENTRSSSHSDTDTTLPIGTLADLMSRLGILERATSRLHHDLDDVIISPRFNVAADGAMSCLSVSDDTLQVTGRMEDSNAADVLQDIRQILDFLHRCLPSTVAEGLFKRILPSLVLQLIESWLRPLVPVDPDELANFNDTLVEITALASYIDNLNVPLPSEANLVTWVEELPSTWMSRRREAALAQMRLSCYKAVNTKMVVERSETQAVAHDDALVAGGQHEDEWSEDWGDDEEEQGKQNGSVRESSGQDDDEDASAWGLEEEPAPVQSEKPTFEGSEEVKENEDEDAWGWGDEGGDAEPANLKPEPPKGATEVETKANGTPKKMQSSTRELTLRESYTVTAIPETIIEVMSQILSDATKLASPNFPIREVSFAVPALSSLPTLLLAFYRATATTFYAADPTANMLIYHDTQHLISLLQQLTASLPAQHPLAGRLRLDADTRQLAAFARRAYGREMDGQRTILRDLLSAAAGFVNAAAPINARQYANAVADTAQRIRDVDALWAPVLSTPARLQSVGSLLATVTAKITDDVLELADDPAGISEEQSGVLKGLCDRVVELADLFEQPDPASGEKRSLVHVYSPGWLRFVYLGEILEASLADIKFLWLEGELSLEFEETEVVDLIEALFADSEYRRTAIREIKGRGLGQGR